MLFVIYHKINSLPRGRYQDANQYRPEEQAPDEEHPICRSFCFIDQLVSPPLSEYHDEQHQKGSDAKHDVGNEYNPRYLSQSVASNPRLSPVPGASAAGHRRGAGCLSLRT